MKTKTLITSMAMLLIGFGMGWLFKPSFSSPENTKTTEIEQPVKTKIPLNIHAPQSSPQERARLISNYTLEDDYKEKKALIDSISDAEIPAYIEEILLQSGPDGLDYKLKSLVRDLLTRMMEGNKMATIQWILSQEHPANRDFLFEKAFDDHSSREENDQWILDNFDQLMTMAKNVDPDNPPLDIFKELIERKADQDLMDSIQLSKQYLVNSDGEISFPSGIQQKAIAAGWDHAFEYFKDSWKDGNSGSSWGWGGDFPADFDFNSFSQAWASHIKTLDLGNNKRSYYGPPKKIWQEWAEADPEAAYQFRTENDVPSFDMDTFLDGYAKSAEPSHMYDFLGDTYDTEGDRNEDRGDIENFISGYISDDQFRQNEFIEWTNNTGDRRLYDELIQKSSYNSTRLFQNLLQNLPAHDRLPYLTQLRQDDNLSISNSNTPNFRTALSDLGHSATEIDTFLNANTDN